MDLLTGSAYLGGTLLLNFFVENMCYRIFPVLRTSSTDHRSYCHRFTVMNRCLFYPILEEAIYTLPFFNPPQDAFLFALTGISSSYSYTGSVHPLNWLALLKAYPWSGQKEVFTLLRFLSGIRFALDHRMNNTVPEAMRVWYVHGSFYFLNWLVSHRLALYYENEGWKAVFPLLLHITNNYLAYCF